MAETPLPVPSQPSERGRYAIYDSPDGGIVIPRAAGLCDTCSKCECGTQQEPIRVPAALVKMAKAAAEGKIDGMAGKLRAMIKL